VKRYDTEIRDGVLYLESDDGWIEVGPMDQICELVGGETYVLEYDEHQRSVAWLDTNEDGTLTFDVRNTIEQMSYDREFVSNIASIDQDDVDGEYPLRASVFADLMVSIWDSKGNP